MRHATARIRVETAAAAIIVDAASWDDLETVIAPAPSAAGEPRDAASAQVTPSRSREK
jgi:hypothetical protein